MTQNPYHSNDRYWVLKKYLEEIGGKNYNPLKPEEEIDLAQRIKKGDKDAFDKLVNCNLRFVVSVAKDYQGQGLDLTDLINEGNIGLIKGVKKFDETRGFKLISYCVWGIRQGILQAIAEHKRNVRLPLNKSGGQASTIKKMEEFTHDYEREPTNYEIQQMNDENIMYFTEGSLDIPIGKDEDRSLYDVIENTGNPDIGEALGETSLKAGINTILNDLKPMERDVIKMYFGIDRKYPMTLQDIGIEFNLTRERVKQIKENAIRRLQHRSRRKKLEKDLGFD